MEISELEVSLAYSYCPDCVLEQGVRFIEFKDKAYFYTKDNLKDALTQDYRNTFHFSPFLFQIYEKIDPKPRILPELRGNFI